MNLDQHTKLGGQRKFPDEIHTEIRVADILALYDDIVYGRFMFICYAIAHLMNEKLKMMPEWDGAEHTFSSAYDGVTMRYSTQLTNPMSDQVNAQCFAFMARLGFPVVLSEYDTLGDFFLDRQWWRGYFTENAVDAEADAVKLLVRFEMDV